VSSDDSPISLPTHDPVGMSGDSAWITPDTIDGGQDRTPLFDGDTGTLPEKVRDVLVTLLKRRYLSAEEHPREYALVLEQEPALRTRLNDQFLDLVVDRRHQVVYKRQAVSETGEKFPTLLYDQAYSREETILLYELRTILSGAGSASGVFSDSSIDSVFVDRSDLLAQVERFRPATATDTVGDTKTTNTAIDGLVKQGLLLKTSQPDRFRIPPIIRILLNVQRLEQLRTWLQDANGTAEPAEQSARDLDVDPDLDPGAPNDDDSPDGNDDGTEVSS
jgi:hypothetical protein